MNRKTPRFCLFCQSHPEEDEEFIDINRNAVELDGEIVEFVDIVAILFNRKIKDEQSAVICERCKDLLIQFYLFAENVRVNNENFAVNENVEKCREYLNSMRSEQIVCSRYDKCFILAPESMRQFIETFQLSTSAVTLEQKEAGENSEIEEVDVEEAIEEARTADEEESEIFQDENFDKSQLQFEPESLSLVDDLEEVEILQDFESQQRHSPEHHKPLIPDTSKRYEKLYCARCNYQFTTQAHFVAHTNGHALFDVLSKHIRFPKCEACNTRFCCDESCELHFQRHESGSTNIKPIASEGFFLKFGFLREELSNGDESKFLDESSPKCGHCHRKFIDDDECVKHLLIFHAQVLTCPIDHRTFKGNQAFTIHMKNNHPELFPDLKFKCSVCKIEFDSLYEKLSHMKTCNDKKFSCNHCDKSFSRKCHLKKHQRQVSGESSVACEVCKKLCRDKHDYQIHFRSHSSEKMFKCSLCPKAYKTSSARAAHLQSHLDIIICPYCEAQFKSRRTMQKHVKTKHENNARKEPKISNDIDIY